MPKLNLYEDCGSLNNFVEQYLNERLDPFLRNEPSTILAKSNVSARELANQSYLNTANAIETFTGELQIAIADYLEDHEAVEWPKEYYRVHMTKTLSSGGRGAEFDRELKKIRRSEEYKTAVRRRSEMPQRIERWQKEMANAIKQ